jgi:serine/threonine-protein kinase
MEYLEGRTLGSQVAGKALPIDRILRVGRQIAEGLEEAHGAGIVHRDLKPDNIFILQRGREKDFVKVLDFGIAKVAKAQAKLTRAGSIFGTPHYMSPEQASGMTVDHRTDIYSLGVILYEMSTGRVPFDAEGPMGILAQHIHNEPVPPSAVEGLSQPVPPALEAIILKCLSKQPDLRYQSMAEVAAELEKASGGIAPEALRELARRVTKQGRNIRRRVERRPLLAAAMALVLAVVLAAYAYANKPPEPPKMQSKVIRPPPGLSGALDFIGKIEDEASVPAPLDQSGHRSVAVIISPIDAHVLMGDENLGTMPVTIRIKENEKAWIRVVRDGYFQKNMSVDGSQSRVVVRLVPIPGSIPAVPAPGARILPGGVQVDVQDLLPRKPAPGSQPAAPASAPAAGASQMGEPPPPPKPAEPASSAKTVTPPSPPAEAHPAPQEKPVPPAAPAEQKPPAP